MRTVFTCALEAGAGLLVAPPGGVPPDVACAIAGACASMHSAGPDAGVKILDRLGAPAFVKTAPVRAWEAATDCTGITPQTDRRDGSCVSSSESPAPRAWVQAGLETGA